MRKVLIILIFFLFCFSFGYANDVYLGMKHGFCWGLQYASDSNLDSNGALFGYSGGIFVNFEIFPLMRLQTEIIVSRRGGKRDEGNYTEKYMLTYIDLPVLVKIPIDFGWGSLSVNTGMQFSFNINAVRLNEYNDTNIARDKLDTNVMDFGALVGVNLDFYLSNHLLFIELQGFFGVLPTISQSTSRNTAINFYMGYGFKL